MSRHGLISGNRIEQNIKEYNKTKQNMGFSEKIQKGGIINV